MGRWDILDGDNRRNAEGRPLPTETGQQPLATDISVGRGPADEPPATLRERTERTVELPGERSPDQRIRYRDKDKTYYLRHSEIAAMTEIGSFRTVDVRDLSRYAYGDDEVRMKRDIDNLREQGLVEEKTLLRAHQDSRKVVTLTKQGHRIGRKASGLPVDQRMYHGFVKSREINHDADLYKVYQQAAQEVREKGGKPLKIRLDFELKAMVQREKLASKELSKDEQRERLERLAKEQGLTVSGATVHVPDIQMEYETREQQLERANLELISEHYRRDDIRGKAESGFTLYARGGDTARVRRALQDTHTVERILSI
jgi:hypothetical protein